MRIEEIKKTFRIPHGDRLYIKCYGTVNDDSSLTKIDVKATDLDAYEPKQIFYILDKDPKLTLEFDEATYKEIEELLNGNNLQSI